MIMHQRQIALSLLFIMIWPVRGFTAPTDSGPFSIEQILSAPFPTALIAAPEGARFAWVSNRLGRRNVWLAMRHATDSGYSARPLTRYTQDDGQEIADLAFVGRKDALVFVRGGDFECNDKPAPNPAHLTSGVEQSICWVEFKSGVPHKLAEGHAPAVSPSGDRIVYLHKGEIWTVAPRVGAKPTQLLKARDDLDEVRSSPDGRKLAFVANRGDHSFVGVYAFADRSLRWIDPSLSNDFEPCWAPDGARLACLRVPAKHDEVGIGPHRSGEPWSIRVATLADDAPSIEAYRAPWGAGSVFHALISDTQLFWTPGDRLVFPAENDGWLHLYAVPATGGVAQPLTPGELEIEYATGNKTGTDNRLRQRRSSTRSAPLGFVVSD
jgi:hypothetical protein